MLKEKYNKFQYFIIFINDYICIIFVKRLCIKNKAFQAFKDFLVYIHIQFGIIVQKICSDNGGEYMNNNFQKEMIDKNIKWKLTVIYNLYENGIAE